MARARLLAVALAFFLSGAAALIYQVTWQRILALHSGVGIYSVAMIVAAFLVGLGLGSHLGGVWSARVTPVRALWAFAGLELAIGVYGAGSARIYYDWLYRQAPGLYATLERATLAHFFSLLLPTLLMGMSLPFLVRAMVRSVAAAGRTVGLLYGINLLGAAFGAALTPWVLVRLTGMRGALAVAATLNVLAGAAALLASLGGSAEAAEDTRDIAGEPPGRWPLRVWAALYALGGFCALALEMLWFRMIEVALKATAFTFGSVLAVYLLGCALGTFWGMVRVHRLRSPLETFLLVQCAIVLYAGASLALLGLLPPELFRTFVSVPHPGAGGQWDSASAARLYLAAAAALYGIPTILMGYSFTVLQRAVHDDLQTSGRKVGLLQAANIGGCVLGSLLVGLGFLTWFGTAGTFRVLMGCGLVFAAAGAAFFGRRLFLPLALAFVLLAVAIPGRQRLWTRLHGGLLAGTMVDEDATGVSALAPSEEGSWRLWVNGRSHSTLPFGGIHTLLGAAPAVMHPSPADVLVIGLGSGDTAWAAGCRAETRSLTVYEILAPERRLLERLSASGAGPPELAAFLRDPRLELRVADGRNALERSPRRFDTIEIDALFPDSPYSGNLYSIEFFELAARRLKPGGLMCTWAPTGRVFASFTRAFPHVVHVGERQVLVGSNEPIVVDPAAWQARAVSPGMVAYLGADRAAGLAAAMGTARAPRNTRSRATDVNLDLFPRDEFVTPSGR